MLGILGLLALALALLLCLRALVPRLGLAAGAAGSAALAAAWAWAGALALSAWQAVTPGPLALLWMLGAALAWAAGRGQAWSAPAWPGWNPLRAGAAAFLLLTLVAAFFGAPNTYDSLSYHLPRVATWAQQASVAPYATHDLRQLYFAPLLEVLGTHLYVMAGSDRLLGSIAWSAYALSAGLLWAAARRLAGARAADFSLLAALTAGMTVAQASAFKNDLLSAALGAAGAFLLWQSAHRREALSAALGGAAFGLAALAKPTVYLLLAPLGLALAWALLRQGGKGLRRLALAGLCFYAVQVPYWQRNLQLGAGPLGPAMGTQSESLSPPLVVAALLKQVALHAPAALGLRDGAARGLDAALRGAGVDPVDPRTTSYWNQPRFGLPGGGPDDATAENWAVLLLFFAVALQGAFWRGPGRVPWLLALAGLVIFSALIKWQPWATRLHAPFFLLAALPVGVGLAGWRPVWAAFAALLLLLGGAPALLHLEQRPLFSSRSVISVPRWQQCFLGRRPDLQARLMEALKPVGQDCQAVALTDGGDNPDYLVWLLLRQQGSTARVLSRGVRNESAVFETQAPAACLGLDLTAMVWGGS